MEIPRTAFRAVRPLVEELKPKHLSHYVKAIIEKTDLIYNLTTDPDLAVSLLSKPTSSANESLYIMYANQFVVPRLRTYHPGGLADLKALYERNREKIADAVEKNTARRQAQAAARLQARQSILSMRASVAAAAEGGAQASSGETGTSLPPQRSAAPAAAANEAGIDTTRRLFRAARLLLVEATHKHVSQLMKAAVAHLDLLYHLTVRHEPALCVFDRVAAKRLDQVLDPKYINYMEKHIVPRIRTRYPGGLAELKALYERNREKVLEAVLKNEGRKQVLLAERARQKNIGAGGAGGPAPLQGRPAPGAPGPDLLPWSNAYECAAPARRRSPSSL
eukprot:tig00020510_g9882.t1